MLRGGIRSGRRSELGEQVGNLRPQPRDTAYKSIPNERIVYVGVAVNQHVPKGDDAAIVRDSPGDFRRLSSESGKRFTDDPEFPFDSSPEQ